MWWYLYNGDMRVGFEKIDDESVDLVFADPPYGEGDKQSFDTAFNNAFRKKNYKMVEEEWDRSSNNDIHDLDVCIIENSWKKLKSGGVLTLTCSDTNLIDLYGILGNSGRGYKTHKMPFYECLYDHDFRFLNCVKWFKPNAAPFFNAKKLARLAPSCEYVLIFSKGLPKNFNYEYLKNDKTDYEKKLCKKEDAQMRDMWLINSTQGNWVNSSERHPTQKPRRLIERIINGYTIAGDVVLDPCFGSCGIGRVAFETDRNFIGFDLEEKYYSPAYDMMQELNPEGQLYGG